MKANNTRLFLLFIFMVSLALPSEARRRPLIGVVPGCQGTEYSILRRTYTDAILRSGGIPVIMPYVDTPEEASLLVSKLDGLMFTGGVDLNPSHYGEDVLNETVEIDDRRDAVEMLYASAALARRLPVLAICRGEQMMNVVLGGSLYQDLPTQKPSEIAHRQAVDGNLPSHAILVEKGSLLHRIMGRDTLYVNSFHHQAVKVPSDKVTVMAVAPDGIVEAYESAMKGQWILAVQFHPEMLVRSDDAWLELFKSFIKESR